jgi:DNA ligase-1
VVAYLVGQPRQGRIGVGWATVARVEVTHAPTPTLTVADLDRTISEIQATVGAGSAGNRSARLHMMLEQATAAEADFIRRLFTGELRQGALEGVMTDAVARAAEVPATAVRRAVLLSGDLAGVAQTALSAGTAGLAHVGLQVLRPLSPMLASTAASVTEALAAMAGPASVEWKLDGVRLQVHRSADAVRLYTRNLNDVTDRLPEVVDLVRGLPVAAAVLDAEVVGVTEEGEGPHRFQDVMSGFGREDHTRRELGMRPYFFDCLHLDGADLVDEPLDVRLDRLARAVGAYRIPGIVTDDAARAEAFLQSALTAGHEGVMVKAISSRYDAGRRGKAWRKVKPVRTLDLVVLAAEWGHGRRRGWLSNLHLGARDPDTLDRFVMVGKTFKGLTDQLLTWQTEALSARRTAEKGIVVHVRPELVIEIALDGVQVSTRYPGGVALRFARVLRYRPDKAPAEADTIDDVRALLS